MTGIDHMSVTDYAIHSDFLIHWTGKDIDRTYDPKWYRKADRRQIEAEAETEYLTRLQNILRFGLWMTEEDDRTFRGVTIPSTPKCCFTELKVSESRKHASQYGRLGIGVKRPFLFTRHGRPLAYFGFGEDDHNDRFLKECARDLQDRRMLNFFKPMNSPRRRPQPGYPMFDYDFYAESEWRLLVFDELLDRGAIIDPRDKKYAKHHDYFSSLPENQQQKLKYLVPLDGWFAMVIYPSMSIRRTAQQDPTVLGEIERIKSKLPDHGNTTEPGNWPIEVTVGDCRQF